MPCSMTDRALDSQAPRPRCWSHPRRHDRRLGRRRGRSNGRRLRRALAHSPGRRAIRQLDDVPAFVSSLDRDLPTPFRLERERLQDRLGAFLSAVGSAASCETDRQALQSDVGRQGRSRVSDGLRLEAELLQRASDRIPPPEAHRRLIGSARVALDVSAGGDETSGDRELTRRTAISDPSAIGAPDRCRSGGVDRDPGQFESRSAGTGRRRAPRPQGVRPASLQGQPARPSDDRRPSRERSRAQRRAQDDEHLARDAGHDASIRTQVGGRGTHRQPTSGR